MGLVALRRVGSSQIRDRTLVPCIGRWILNHWTTGEVPDLWHFKSGTGHLRGASEQVLEYSRPQSCSRNAFDFSSLVTQAVKNLPAMQETPLQFLGREDPEEKGIATHSSILAWRVPWTERSLADYSPWGRRRVGHSWASSTFTFPSLPFSSGSPKGHFRLRGVVGGQHVP